MNIMNAAFAVYNNDTGEVVSCHHTKQAAFKAADKAENATQDNDIVILDAFIWTRRGTRVEIDRPVN